MISVNQAKTLDEAGIKRSVDNFIVNMLDKANLESLDDKYSKQQLLQIHASKIFSIENEKFTILRNWHKKHALISTSRIQKKVETYLKKACPTFVIEREYFNPQRAAYVDLLIKRDPHNPRKSS